MNYLYNGVELPALPEWDRETYPYVLFYHVLGGFNGLLAFSTDMYLGKIQDSEKNAVCASSLLQWSVKDGSWCLDDYAKPQRMPVEYIKWSNFDFVISNKPFCLTASYPINAETGEEVTEYGLYHIPVNPPYPTGMLMGYMVGQAIRK